MRATTPLGLAALACAAAVGAYLSLPKPAPNDTDVPPAETPTVVSKVIVNDQALKNLGITAKPLTPGIYWKTLSVPGMVVDRPGRSDRGVVAPATGVVTAVLRVPGDAVRPGDKLFTMKLLSESMHLTQTELFKTAQDVKLAAAQKKRLAGSGGIVPEARLIEIDNQLKRLAVAEKAYRQELQNRGLSPEAIDGIAAGTFVNELVITAPAEKGPAESPSAPAPYEVQELKAELGQQVTAGQTLCLLADHRLLAIEGKAFRDEVPLVERSVREGWPVEVEFNEDGASGWGPFKQSPTVRRVSNVIDPVNRTFSFQLPLENEWKSLGSEADAVTLWRYRPGQRVRLLVRAERLENVFVLPADAVVRDGAEAFVFTQNENTFSRRAITLLYRDRRHAVVANDGVLLVGEYASQGAAAQLNRMVKSASGGGAPKGYHIHADGSLHKNEDEGK